MTRAMALFAWAMALFSGYGCGDDSEPNDTTAPGNTEQTQDGGVVVPIRDSGKDTEDANDSSGLDGAKELPSDAGTAPASDSGSLPDIIGQWYASGPNVPSGEYCFIFCNNGRFFFNDTACSVDSADFLTYFEYLYDGATVEAFSKNGLALTFEMKIQGEVADVLVVLGSGDEVQITMSRIEESSPHCTNEEASLSNDM